MKLTKQQSKTLLKAVRAQIIKGESEGLTTYSFNPYSGYTKPRKKFGLKTMTTLYELESILLTEITNK